MGFKWARTPPPPNNKVVLVLVVGGGAEPPQILTVPYSFKEHIDLHYISDIL